MAKLPTIKELASLIRSYKPEISDEYLDEDETVPGIDLTIGWSDKTGNWSYQSGDNSYSGGAYNYPIWGVVRIYRRSDSRELARDLINQLSEQTY